MAGFQFKGLQRIDIHVSLSLAAFQLIQPSSLSQSWLLVPPTKPTHSEAVDFQLCLALYNF